MSVKVPMEQRHGTYLGYNRGCRCEPCCAAHRVRMNDYIKSSPDQRAKQTARRRRWVAGRKGTDDDQDR